MRCIPAELSELAKDTKKSPASQPESELNASGEGGQEGPRLARAPPSHKVVASPKDGAENMKSPLKRAQLSEPRNTRILLLSESPIKQIKRIPRIILSEPLIPAD
ncbi:MAG TPA: hypothetical protein VF398_04505 [bacterium]